MPDSAYCPECNNKYRVFDECPECLVKLKRPSINQNITGNHNQTTLINNNNIGGINNTTHISTPPNIELAEYEAKVVTNYPSFWHLIKWRIYGAGGLGITALFSWISGSASIMSWFGIQPNQLGTIIAALLFIGCVLLTIRTLDLAEITNNKWVRKRGVVYANENEGSITEYRVSGQCPIPGCGGSLYLGKPPSNYEHVEFCGMCSDHSFSHAFEFNDKTYKGVRIRITPKPDKKTN